MADYVGGDMIRGHIDTIILNSLIDGDKDTNQIREEIEQRAEGRFQLKQGTFYSALQRISKQGLVNEYRTTGSDGVRRKFFQLTEKGKAHIEQTQNSWTMSRQVINSLIDAPQSEEVKQAESEIQEDKLPVFENEERIVASFAELESSADFASENQSEADILVFGAQEEDAELEIPVDDVVLSEIEQDENNDTVPELPQNHEEVSPTFDEFLDIMARINADAELQSERESEQLSALDIDENNDIAEEIELNKDEETAVLLFENLQGSEVSQQTENNNLSEIEIEEDQQDNTIEFAEFSNKNEQIIIPEFDNLVQFDQPIQPEAQDKIEAQVTADEVDDFLDSSNIPSTMDYKEVLNKIFINQKEPQKAEVSVNTTSTERDEELVVEQETVDNLNYDVLVDELDFTDKEDEIANRERELRDHRRVRRSKQASASKSAIDYSDIIALSQEEGFKVTTSDRTNKNELGKILINKLNFHSLLIFYILIGLETLIVSLTMENVLQFGVEAYIIFASVTLLLPIISGIIYYMAPKRTVAEVNSFKSSFETALIITLNLILLTLAVAIFINLDFSSQQSITRVIFIPIMIVINIPLYVVIRHSLLEKQMYFS